MWALYWEERGFSIGFAGATPRSGFWPWSANGRLRMTKRCRRGGWHAVVAARVPARPALGARVFMPCRRRPRLPQVHPPSRLQRPRKRNPHAHTNG